MSTIPSRLNLAGPTFSLSKESVLSQHPSTFVEVQKTTPRPIHLQVVLVRDPKHVASELARTLRNVVLAAVVRLSVHHLRHRVQATNHETQGYRNSSTTVVGVDKIVDREIRGQGGELRLAKALMQSIA